MVFNLNHPFGFDVVVVGAVRRSFLYRCTLADGISEIPSRACT